MDIKKYFDDPQTIVSSTDIESLAKEVESHDYMGAYIQEKERFVPRIDFSSASNFAFFGSAEQYYNDAVKRIYQTYPYDGSLYEKTIWQLSSSYLDNYIFENEYPRTNGFIRLTARDNSTPYDGAASNNYFSSSTPEYILFRGGPHPSIRGKGKKVRDTSGDYRSGYSNVYDQSHNRESNLKIDGSDGNTVEFWMKKTAVTAGKREVIFDAYTVNATELEAGHGRIAVEILGHATTPGFQVTYISGSDAYGVGFQTASIGQGITSNFSDDEWHHYAFTFTNSGSLTAGNLQAKLYVDGKHNNTIVGATTNLIREQSTATIDYVSGGMLATIGALATSPRGDSTPQLGWAPFSGALDEFRFWKTERSAQQIGRHWFTQVGGGTNTDDANTHLGVYYKFNEGITSSEPIDSTVLDYSGRINNGTWTGYTSGHRSTESAIVLSNVVTASYEFKDPILYSSHPDVNGYLTSSVNKGKYHDLSNNAAIYNSLPAWIIDEDSESGEVLKKLTQIMASYFDTLQLQIQELPTLQNIAYPSGSYEKPHHFIRDALESKGFTTSEIFADADILAQFLNQSNEELFEKKLYHVKNQIYQNIYNSLSFIYKTKGTEKAFRNLIRCFGIDHEILKLNVYADESDYTFEDNFSSATVKKNCIDFNNPTRLDGTIYQVSSSTNANSISFISGSPFVLGPKTENQVAIPFTTEAEVIFPRKGELKDQNHFIYPGSKSSLFGMHTAKQVYYVESPSRPYEYNDFAWNEMDVANFQVYACRKTSDENIYTSGGYTNKDAYFMLSSSAAGFALELTSSVFQRVYDDNKWNFAVRVKPKKYPLATYISGTLGAAEPVDDRPYVVEFYGVNSDLGVINNEFLLTGALSRDTGESFLSSSKRVYAGAHRTNFSGSTLTSTDIKFSSLRCWLDYLDNETIQAHARNPKNIGRLNPYKPAYLFEIMPADASGSNQPYVPQMETLVLNWDFTGITGSGPASSDSYYGTSAKNASFLVTDMSSGSINITSSYGAISEITSMQYTGKGDFFLPLRKSVVSKEYIYSAKQNLPENVNSSDMVRILDTDDVASIEYPRPTTNFFAIEKSMYQTISEEILRFFATIKDFNNLIGEPVNRYRQDYKALGKLRQLFFERKVEDTGGVVSPDLEKYIDYYKWIDQSISKMIRQIIPASAQFSENIRNMIESHILERNKYWSKLPIVEQKIKPTVHPYETFAGNKGVGNNANLDNEGVVGGAKDDMSPAFVVAHPDLTNKFKTIGPAKMSIRLPDNEEWSTDDETKNTLSWAKAAPTELAISSGNSDVDSARQKIFNIINSGYQKANRTPVKFSARILKPVHGGVNHLINKKPTLFKTLINNVSGSENVGLEITSEKVEENDIIKEFRRLYFPDEKKREIITTSRARSRGSSADIGENDYFGDSYTKWTSPFTVISSSVNTGYNQLLSSSFTSSIDFANLHQDIYAPHYEVPMQGTFTEKWVGGFPYRHVFSQFQSNTFTPDGATNRVEGWKIDFKSDPTGQFVVFRSPISASINNPRAMFWAGPKSPVNIKNIRMTTGSGGFQDPTGSTKSGNYRFDYNIVSTSGREINNRYFVKNSGIDIDWKSWQKPGSSTLPVQGVSDFTSIDRSVTGSNKFVFVNRFNAPGGPETMCEAFLDLESGEYSVYNCLNYRNLAVRLPLREYLTNHCNQFGYWSDAQYSASWVTAENPHAATRVAPPGSYTGTKTTVTSGHYRGTSVSRQPMASYHKINRNPIKRIELDAASSHTFFTGTVYDNYWVQHPIPRTDLQYSWISASLIHGYDGAALYGYDTGSAGAPSNAITFLTASEVSTLVDFAGMNTLIYDPVNSPINLLSASSGDYRNTSVASLSQPDDLNSLILHRQGPYGWPSWKQIRGAQHPVTRYKNKNNMFSFVTSPIQCFTESIATSRFKPIVHIFKEGLIQHTYGNNLASFANVEIQNKLKHKLYGGDQVYDNIKNLYLEDIVSFKPNLISLYYKEMIYPREINVYLAKARMRTNYVVEFWREASSDRVKTNITNSQGQTILKQSIWALDGRTGSAAEARRHHHSPGNDGAGELQNNYSLYHGGTNEITPAACYIRPISASAAEGDIVYGDALYEAGSPFYDSYDDYSNEIRRVGQNYSITSEFRMSEHMEYFLDEKNGDFFEDREGFLTCTGSNYANSTVDNFFKTYSHSDFLKYFSLIHEDHKGVLGPSKIILTCNAMMKLLPYKGFYPADRTLQLATLFSQSYGSSDFATDGYSDRSKRRISLAPFFAPGILYNSIKSGIAVDYPIYTKQPGSTTAGATVTRTTPYSLGTGSTAINADGGYNKTTGICRLSASFDFRLPFDSLVRPETYIGNGSYIYEAEPDPTARLSGSADSTEASPVATGSIKLDLIKSDTYKLAMHNFLATSVDLFLKNGELSTIISSKKPDYIVDPNPEGGSYKLRFYLTDHQDVSRDDSTATLSKNFSMFGRQSAFGPTVNAPDNKGGYAPFTPGYLYDDDSAGYTWRQWEFTPFAHDVADKYGTEGTDMYTLDEILANSTITDYRSMGNSQLTGGAPGINYVQDINMMNLTSSVSFFQKDDHFVAQTKFETPIFNFINASKTSFTEGDTPTTKGMWLQKGTYETNNSKGIFFGALDVAGASSMADLLGIDKGLKKIGILPDNKEKTIREAVVAIPIIKKFNRRTQRMQTKFINIHKNIVKRAVADILAGKTLEESSVTTSVYNMVKTMRRYIIPPQFDFLTQLKKFGSRRFRPFAMYLFEFEHEFSQEELANIWQNIRPEIAETHKKEKATICHPLEQGELLTAKELSNPDLHWMIFKVKQKAKWNYFDKAIDLAGMLPPQPDAGTALASVQLGNPAHALKADSHGSLNPFQGNASTISAQVPGTRSAQIPADDMSNTTTQASGGGSGLKTHTTTPSLQANIKHELLSSGIRSNIEDTVDFARLESDVASGYGLDYSYNWPYDFCSLVELIKVDVETQFGGKGMVQVHPSAASLQSDMESLGSGKEGIVVTGDGAQSISSRHPDIQEESRSATTVTTMQSVVEQTGNKLQLIDGQEKSRGQGSTAQSTGTKLGLID